ncbi:MAG TPA: hypothetical protein VFQ95_00980 [Rhodanobacteraceae bacterium]|nr:hypothetical protein [Rhodanobacteraceae bacterium]
MPGNHPWWVLVVLVACGLALSLAQWAYFEWRLRSLAGRFPTAGTKPADAADKLVGGLLRVGAQLEASLHEALGARVYGAAPTAAADRYRLARDMASGGASAASIADACGVAACEAELLRAVHAERATQASRAAHQPTAEPDDVSRVGEAMTSDAPVADAAIEAPPAVAAPAAATADRQGKPAPAPRKRKRSKIAREKPKAGAPRTTDS